MTFTSLFFLPFLVLCLSVIYLIGILFRRDDHAKVKIQLFAILLFSYAFVAFNDFVSLGVLIAASFITFFSSIALEKTEGKCHNRIYAASVILLLLLLAFFKYSDFVVRAFLQLMKGNLSADNLMFPVGISFYIFTDIGYLSDIKNGRYRAEPKIVNVMLLNAFFPKLISGPIVRGDVFFQQLREYDDHFKENFSDGIQIFLIGAFKKLVFADRLGIFVDDVFFSPTAYTGMTVALAIISYSLQIWFDFSGYSDMAIGVSRMLGIKIDKNFDLPYIAHNASDFWKRWHISLSSWLRDYIYIPLGGSRKSAIRAGMNLMAVMIISGIWHGNGMTFIVWGMLHGAWAIICKIFHGRFKAVNDKWTVLKSIISMVMTYLVTALLWVFFRAENLGKAYTVILSVFSGQLGISQPYVWSFAAIAVTIISTSAAAIKAQGGEIHSYYPIQDLETVKGLTLTFVLIGIIFIFGYFGDTAFIYGRF